jgi:hypothetical protein
VDVSGVNRGCDGQLPDVAKGGSLGIDHWGPHEGGDTRPLIGVLCHKIGRGAQLIYLLPRMLAQLAPKGDSANGYRRLRLENEG